MHNLTDDIEEEKKDDLTNSICHCIWITIKYLILLIVFFMVVFSDIFLPIYTQSKAKNNNETNSTVPNNSTNSDNSNNDNEDSGLANKILDIIAVVFLLIFIIILNSAYTIIVTYSLNRRNYISGDYLSGKKKNDNISLMKTVNEITGYAFALVYCNIYYYKMYYLLENEKNEIIFYNEIEIPDYEITPGLGVFMIAKLVIIIFSIFMFSCTEGVFNFFKSDLSKFNK